MTPTAFRQAGRRDRRRGGAAALATLGAAALALTAAPVAQAGSAGTLAASVETSEAEVQGDLSIKFTELRELIARHEADGGVTYAGARRMLAPIGVAEWYYDIGYNQRAALWLENARPTAEDPNRVPSEVARTEIVAAIDELIALLGGLPS